MENGSSLSAQAMAVVSSAAVASNGSLIFAVGSSDRFSFCSVTTSNTGPLCWLHVLGATDEVSSLKESSTGKYCWAGCGSLERRSKNRFALPARHRKPMSYCCRLSAHLCSFGSRLRLRNRHVSAKQSGIKVKRLPATYYLTCLMAQKIAVYSRSVGPQRESTSFLKGEDPLLVSYWLQEQCHDSRGAGVCLSYEGVIPVEDREHCG